MVEYEKPTERVRIYSNLTLNHSPPSEPSMDSIT